MTSQTFALEPFPGTVTTADITLNIAITRSSDNQLSLRYTLEGAIEQIQFAPKTDAPQRQWQLWETTCFECFIGRPDQINYWEFNLAPNANWNAFALDDYRQGIREAESIQQIAITTERTRDRFTLSTVLPLNQLVDRQFPIAVSITAVIQDQSGALSYWAIQHSGSEPNFHQRDSFVVQLSPAVASLSRRFPDPLGNGSSV